MSVLLVRGVLLKTHAKSMARDNAVAHKIKQRWLRQTERLLKESDLKVRRYPFLKGLEIRRKTNVLLAFDESSGFAAGLARSPYSILDCQAIKKPGVTNMTVSNSASGCLL